ncbi:MAG: hypothetical protein RLZZ524_1595 [Pseudomonadota bacterium]
MSAFADVTAAIVATLTGIATVRRGYAWPMAEAVDAEIVVRPEATSQEATGIGSGPVDWRTTVVVQIRKRYTPDSTSADAAIDGLLGQVFAALAGVTGTGIQDVLPAVRIDWDYSAADSNVIAVSFTAEVLHRTEATTLTAWT